MTACPPTAAQRPKLVVLISGHGSNLQALLDASASGVHGSQHVQQVPAGVPARPFPKLKAQDRHAYDAALAEIVAADGPDWVVLAGWMRLLSPAFLDHFPGRVVNLHPALPGTFAGTHAIDRAYAAYQRGEITQTGVMVHLVPDAGMDCGPVLAQQVVPILPDDTLEALEARIHAVEHRLLVITLKDIINTDRVL